MSYLLKQSVRQMQCIVSSNQLEHLPIYQLIFLSQSCMEYSDHYIPEDNINEKVQ